MQIFFILVFESTSVFQRIKTMKMLNGMTAKPFFLQVYRDRKWTVLSTTLKVQASNNPLPALCPPFAFSDPNGLCVRA